MRDGCDLYKYYPKTTENIIDEPWYHWYQLLCEIMAFGCPRGTTKIEFWEEMPNGKEEAFKAVKARFVEIDQWRVGLPTSIDKSPDDEHIRHWIDCCWLTEEDMAKIRALEE